MFDGVNAVDVLTAAGVLWLTVRVERVAGRVDALAGTVQTVLSALVRRPDRAGRWISSRSGRGRRRREDSGRRPAAMAGVSSILGIHEQCRCRNQPR